jgi:hypothetical protein
MKKLVLFFFIFSSALEANSVVAATPAVDAAWVKSAIRRDTVFDYGSFVPYDERTGYTFLEDDEWPKVSHTYGSPPITFELRMARFSDEKEAAKMIGRLRRRVSTGGSELTKNPGITEQMVFFGTFRVLARRKDVVFDLESFQSKDIATLVEATRGMSQS